MPCGRAPACTFLLAGAGALRNCRLQPEPVGSVLRLYTAPLIHWMFLCSRLVSLIRSLVAHYAR